MTLPLSLAHIPLGATGLALTVSEGIAAVIDCGLALDAATGLTDEQAEALIADARRWILLGPVEALSWFAPALARARQARPMMLAAE
ncbi:hypothetical protein ABNQ39_00385 (plasmid) [Azospirillum sp. A26]|uniref:hypothetical protein n=1 Tax=Azospirillum sp. A26 TaxID=3160607 RepID=UPI003670F3FE